MSKATILQGDVRDVLATLPERHFHCAVTSPPYWGLRSYLPANSPDKAREIGSEKTPQEFVATMVDVFRGVKRVLRDDGVCWINLGSTYAASQIAPNRIKIRADLSIKEKCDVAVGLFDLWFSGNSRQGERALPEMLSRGIYNQEDSSRSGIPREGITGVVPETQEKTVDFRAQAAAGVEVGSNSDVGRAMRVLRRIADGVSHSGSQEWRRLEAQKESLREVACGIDSNIPGHSCIGVPGGPLPDTLLELQLFDWLLGVLPSQSYEADRIPRELAGYFTQDVTFKPKDLIPIPWMVALALQADGWYLRDAVIWHKPSPMPSSQRDRCTSSYEFVFQLTKRATYFFDLEAIREPAKFGRVEYPNAKAREGRNAKSSGMYRTVGDLREGVQRGNDQSERVCDPTQGAVSRNVWRISSDGYKGEHYATFPVELPARCIKASTSAKGCCPDCGAPWRRIVDRTPVTRERPNELTKRTGVNGTGNHCANTVAGVEARTLGWEPTCKCGRDDVEPCRVLDPFNGAGTTAIACRRLGVDYTGIELDARAIEQTHARLRKEANRGAKVERIESAAGQQELFR